MVERSDHDTLILLEEQVSRLVRDMELLEADIKKDYVLKVEFTPIVKILWTAGIASILALTAAILKLILK